MPDITMCATSDCPIASTCRRNEQSGTTASDFRQSWSAYSWRNMDGHVHCDSYWPVSDGNTAAVERLIEDDGA